MFAAQSPAIFGALRLVLIAISGLIKKQVMEAGNVVTLGADTRLKCISQAF